MLFNGKKFELMRYGPKEELKNSTNYFTPQYEDIIEEKETLRDLGVIMSNKATFAEHIEHVCTKVKQKSGWILRTFQSRDTQFLKFMWKSLVQGHIENIPDQPYVEGLIPNGCNMFSAAPSNSILDQARNKRRPGEK